VHVVGGGQMGRDGGDKMNKLWVAAISAAVCASGHAALAAMDAKDELVAIEASWSKAIVAKDAAAVGKIVAADWSGQNASGKTETRDKMLADLKAGSDSSSAMTNHDVHVRVIGDIAIVQGADDEKSMRKGKDVSGTYTWTDIFQKRAGHWVAIASQSTPVKPEK
jgi:ketosteroid isomerase-like protein